jgi:hypothetical protein
MIRTILFSIIFLVFFSGCQRAIVYDQKINIDGIVIEKYVDHMNHNSETCTILQADGTIEIITSTDYKGIWDYVEVGDTVRKKSQTLILKIKKVSGEEKEFEYINMPWSFKLF